MENVEETVEKKDSFWNKVWKVLKALAIPLAFIAGLLFANKKKPSSAEIAEVKGEVNVLSSNAKKAETAVEAAGEDLHEQTCVVKETVASAKISKAERDETASVFFPGLEK